MGRLISLSKPTCAPTWVVNRHPGRMVLRLAGLLGLLVLLSACTTLQDPEAFQEFRSHTVASLSSGTVVEQEIRSRHTGLQKIELWISVDKNSLTPEARLTALLFDKNSQGTPLASVAYRLSDLSSSSALALPFERQGESYPSGEYRLQVQAEGGTVYLFGRNEDAYAQGAFFINNQPVDADLSFRLSYQYTAQSALEDLCHWVGQAAWLLPLLVLLWLPGRLLISIAHLEQRLDWGERSAVSVALSLASFPLLMAWTSTLKFNWSRNAVLGYVLALGLLYLALLIRKGAWKAKWSVSWPSLALAAVLFFSLAVRLAMIRDLAAPAWVDSVHHALLGRLIQENGGYPASYEPYLQVSTTGYHSGYHSLLAALSWLSGQDLGQTMLVFGQALNTLAILGVYLLTTTLTRMPVAGVLGALIAGLMTPMPAYYTSWGRYTQLAGLVVLPAAFWLAKTWLDAPRQAGWRKPDKHLLMLLGLACLVASGLLLIHYRVLAFLVMLVLADRLVGWLQAAWQRRGRESLWKDLAGLVLLAVFSLLLTLPWWPGALASFVVPVAAAPGATRPFADFAWSFLTTALGKYALGLAGLGLLTGIVQRRAFAWVIFIWTMLLFFLANLGVFSLPGANFVNNTSVTISLYIPIAVLGGYLLGWVIQGWEVLVKQPWKPVYWGAVTLAGSLLAFYAARSLLPILNPGTLLVRQADLEAIEWIDSNLPEDAYVLINPFAWGYNLYAGNDGGYWISPLAGRKTFPPAAIYNFDFQSDNPQIISANAQEVIELGEKPVELASFMTEHGLQYVYCGVRGGPISPRALRESSEFRLIYQKDGVSLFQIDP